MKRLFILFNFLLITSIICHAQNDSLCSIEKFHGLKNQVEKLDFKIRDIKRIKDEQESIILQANQTISNQNSLINSFGIIYTILTIFIALIAVGLPIITYQFGIKPSKQALMELEENLDKRVAEYLKTTRKQQIKKSIEHLKGENEELKSQAISFLSLTQHEGFSDTELFDFYKLLKTGTLSASYVSTVSDLLASRENIYADELFNDKKSLENMFIKLAAYQYFSKVGFQKFIKILKSIINSEDGLSEFLLFVKISIMYSRNSTIAIFNNKELIDCIDIKELKDIKSSITGTHSTLEISLIELEDTYFNKRIEKASV